MSRRVGLRVAACGPGASLQDRGRFGLQRHGVSPAGAMDQEALAAANALVGNDAGTAAIELMLAGASFVVEDGPALLAVAGGGAVLTVGGRRVPPFTSAHAAPGETVAVGPPREGLYACLAVSGGFALEPELGALSLHRRSAIGPPPLAPGMLLPLAGEGPPPRPMRLPTPTAQDGPIRVVTGPQADHFTPEALETLAEATFTVSANADRMGVRLDGATLAHARGFNIVSDGIATGSIQVPGDGRPIVLMRDRQTTGGYPKIATVISADLSRFAQIRPGEIVRFAIVTREEAVAAARAARARIESFGALLQPALAPLSTETLLRENLIGGVTAG